MKRVDNNALLCVENLVVSYRKQVALQVDELEVPNGKVLIVGPNGSGKTTLIRALLGLIRPKRGRVRLLGLDPFREAKELFRRVTFVRDIDELHNSLRVATLIDILSSAYNPDAVREAVELLELDKHMDKKLGELSKGMRRRASLLVAAASNKELIVIDEPFSGIDSRSRRIISQILDRKNTNMIIISHIPPTMKFNHLIYIESGKIAYTGPYKDPKTLGLDLC